MRRAVACWTMLALASPLAAQTVAPDAGAAGTAFAELEQEVVRRTRELATREFGFYGQDERRRLERELAHLQRIHQRLKGYQLALPAGCPAFWRPGSQRTAQPTQVATPGGVANLTGRSASAPPRPGGTMTPHDFYCRPRGSVPDEIVAKVRASEDAKRALRGEGLESGDIAARRALETRVAELETELAKLGVPGDLYQPVTKIEAVTPSVQGGEVQR
ncbi:MAG: hypothetical protein JXR83_13530 [Deltaproteobacteria bacterium]|nr:hypothetical protein [Deltaproteobacteria bacterium]